MSRGVQESHIDFLGGWLLPYLQSAEFACAALLLSWMPLIQKAFLHMHAASSCAFFQPHVATDMSTTDLVHMI